MEKFVVKNVSKSFQLDKNIVHDVLNDITFKWNENEIIAIMGESGSGKSTIAKILVGIEKPSSGKVLFNNDDIIKWKYKDWKIKRKFIQAVFQDTSGTLNIGLSVYKNLEEVLINLTKYKKHERKKIILDLIKEAGMSENLLNIKTHNLSGGEQRRLSLLRALAIKPKFLVLDEITSGLDFKTENDICELLIKYNKMYNVGYLLITHDENFAKKLASKIFYMQSGKFVRIGERGWL